MKRGARFFSFCVSCFLFSAAFGWVLPALSQETSVAVLTSSKETATNYRGFRSSRQAESAVSEAQNVSITLADAAPGLNGTIEVEGLRWHAYQRYNDAINKTGITVYINCPAENAQHHTNIQIRGDSSLYVREARMDMGGEVLFRWTTVPPFSMTLLVKDKNDTFFVGRPTAGNDYKRFYQRLLQAQYVPDESLRDQVTQVTEQGPVNKYSLVYVLDNDTYQIKLWSNSSTVSDDQNRVALVTRETSSETMYLEEVLIRQNGQTNLTWSRNVPPFITTVVANETGEYAAELTSRTSSVKFFIDARNAETTPDPHLFRMVKQETKEMNGQAHYCFFVLKSFENSSHSGYPRYDQLWSTAPLSDSPHGYRPEVITRKAAYANLYLKKMWIKHDGLTKLVWTSKPQSSMKMYVIKEDDFFVAELNQSAKWADFYRKVLQAQTTPDELLQTMVTKVTRTFEGVVYYLVDYMDRFSARFHVWSVSPERSWWGTDGYLVTRTMENVTQYLGEATDFQNGTITNAWSSFVPSETTFYSVFNEEDLQGKLVVRPTIEAVFDYVAVEDAPTVPTVSPHGGTEEKDNDDQQLIQGNTSAALRAVSSEAVVAAHDNDAPGDADDARNATTFGEPSDDLSADTGNPAPSSEVVASAEPNSCASVSVRSLWIAPEHQTNVTDATPSHTAPNFKCVLELGEEARVATLLRLLPGSKVYQLPTTELP